MFGKRILVYYTSGTGNNLYELFFGLLLAPISFGYLIQGRFFIAKLFFANNRCESCMRCAAFCPRRAVEAGHSWGVIVWYLTTVPVAYYLFSWLGGFVPSLVGMDKTWLGTLVYFLYWYPVFFLPYYLFQLLLRIPAVNRLFTYTTLTHYWGRYREPEVKFKQLVQ